MKRILTTVTALALAFASPLFTNTASASECCSTVSANLQEAGAKDKAAPAKADEAKAAIIKKQLPFYPNNLCIVSGKPLGDEPINTIIDGRLVRTCCKKCAGKVTEAAKEILAKLDEQVIAAQVANYPMTKCLISDEALDSMGGPLDIVHEGRLARLCCKGCVKSFKKDPKTHFAAIDAAMIEQQKKTYTLKTCVVSGKDLSEEDGIVDFLYGDKLVRVCCKRCVKGFKKTPAKFLAAMQSE